MKSFLLYLTVAASSLAWATPRTGPNGIQGDARERFNALLTEDWSEVFFDSGTEDWKANWYLDGLKSTVTKSPKGMNLKAGPTPKEDASHTVLWTKRSFTGDLKIEYEYTRTDKANQFVNIIYIQATGSGNADTPTDIREWANDRTIPAMSTYFNNMHTYHISYAAYGGEPVTDDFDYIRLRRYRPDLGQRMNNTEIEPDIYQRTQLFQPDIPHKITIVKKGKEIFLHIENPDKDYICHWRNDKHPGINTGSIGLRHMWTRSARYKNFTVSTLD